MEYFKIGGGKKLSGQISVHGAKNSALPILASTLLIKGESVIHNCPDLSDVRVTLDILKSLGCKVKREKSTVLVDASVVNKNEISEHYALVNNIFECSSFSAGFGVNLLSRRL